MQINSLAWNPNCLPKSWPILLLALLLEGSGWGATTIAADDNHPASFRVEVHGHGRAMILIPGYASSGDTWKSTVAHFQDRYTCYVLTLAGFAGVPPIETPLLASVRDDLTKYIRQNQLEKPVIVGHSLGGTLALELGARFPELVGPLVIVDSLPFMAGPTFRVKTLDEAKPGIAAMHAYMSAQTREQYDQGVRSAGGFQYMVTGSGDLELLKQWGLSTDPKTAADAMAGLYSMDLRPELPKISSPTLVLGTWIGLREQLKQYLDLTRAGVVDTFQQQYASLPNLHFTMSDTARHFIMFDDPDWFFRRLEAFLANPAAAVADRGFGGK